MSMASWNSTVMCSANYLVCDMVTISYAGGNKEDPTQLFRMVKWIPAMVGYAVCSLLTLATLVADTALMLIVGGLSLMAGLKSQALNDARDGCLYSIYYDLQCLSVALVGTVAPEAAVYLRVNYLIVNAMNMCGDCIRAILV